MAISPLFPEYCVTVRVRLKVLPRVSMASKIPRWNYNGSDSRFEATDDEAGRISFRI